MNIHKRYLVQLLDSTGVASFGFLIFKWFYKQLQRAYGRLTDHATAKQGATL